MKNKKYITNIMAIKEVFPSLTDHIKKSKKPVWLKHINKIVNNFLIDNQLMYKHEQLEKTPHTGGNKSEMTIILGIGNGFLLNHILHTMKPEHKVLVVEPVSYLTKIVLENYDFSHFFKNKSLIITTTKDETRDVFAMIDSQLIIISYKYICENYTLRRSEYLEIGLLIKNLINQISCSVGTIIGAGKVMAHNNIESLPYIIKYRGVAELINLFVDKPAILVNTGPSLEKNIHNLINIQDKVVIIAVAQALRLLLAYDIKPDFICTVDYGKTNYSHFEGLMDSQIPLIALDKTYPPILKEYQGPIFITTAPFASDDKSAPAILNGRGTVQGGGSVSHLCFNIAIAMGCNPITLIGSDLALGEMSHNKQVDSIGTVKVDKETNQIKWEVQDPFSNLYGDTYNMGQAQQIPGYFGGAVLSTTALISFLTTYEHMIERLPKDKIIINATEGGAQIKGAKRLRLKQVIDTYCQLKINKTKFKELLILPDTETELIENKVKPLIKLMEKDIQVLYEIIHSCEGGLENDKKLRQAIKRFKKRIPKLLIENTKITQLVANLVQKVPIISLLIHKAKMRIHHHSMRTDKPANLLINNPKEFLINVKRNETILTMVKEEIEELKNIYMVSQSLLMDVGMKDDTSLLKEKAKDEIKEMSKIKQYIENGNFAYPIMYFRRRGYRSATSTTIKANVLKLETIQDAKYTQDNLLKIEEWHLPRCLDLLLECRLAGAEGKFEEALNYLETAALWMPNNQEIKWGLATTLWHTKDYEKSIKQFEELILLDPNNYDYQHELAQVMICANKPGGVIKLIQVMKKTDKYDKSFKPLGNLYFNKGKIELAKEAYRQYLMRFPDDVEIQGKLKKCQ